MQQYTTDVFYNTSEFVLKAVQEAVEKKLDIKCAIQDNYLFPPKDITEDQWDTLIKLLEQVVDPNPVDFEAAHDAVNGITR